MAMIHLFIEEDERKSGILAAVKAFSIQREVPLATAARMLLRSGLDWEKHLDIKAKEILGEKGV